MKFSPIQIGENFMGPEQMAQALAAGACDFVMPDAQRIGGVTGWMRAAALAQGAGVEMSSHLFPEASCHLLAATPTCHWLEFVDWAAPVLQDPLQVRGGHVPIPERPGLGMTWDEKAGKRFAVWCLPGITRLGRLACHKLWKCRGRSGMR